MSFSHLVRPTYWLINLWYLLVAFLQDGPLLVTHGNLPPTNGFMGFPSFLFLPYEWSHKAPMKRRVFWAHLVASYYHEPPGGFPGASALVIPRSRFAPVKTTNVTWCTPKKLRGREMYINVGGCKYLGSQWVYNLFMERSERNNLCIFMKGTLLSFTIHCSSRNL